MTKLATKWINLPNALHIQRVLDYMKANPLAWEDDWNDHIVSVRDAHFDANAHCRKTARALDRKSGWNSAFNAAWAIEKKVHAAEHKAKTQEAAAAKIGEEVNGLPYFMFTHAVDAVNALVTYDDCAYMLDANPADVLTLALSNNPAALLIYPACVAFNKIK